MGTVLFRWILVGIILKITGSVGIDELKSGSEGCNLTLRINPSPVFFTGYQSLEIFKHANNHSDYSLLDCRVHSVKILRGFRGKIPLKRKIFTRVVTKKHNANIEVILRHRNFKHLPVDKISVLVELECNGRRCSLLSAGDDTIKKSIPQSFWAAQRRKLLSLRTDNSVDNRDLPVSAAPVLVAVVGIIVLIVALAMCACGNNTHEKALSDEVGGTEVDHHVVAVSTVRIEDKQQVVTEHETPVKSAKNEDSDNDRRNTNESQKSDRNSQSATENGAVNAKGRAGSQSSQPEKDSRPRSSGSRSSVDKIEEAPLLESPPSEKVTESVTPERKRTASDKENGSKENNSSSEARTRTDSSEATKKSIFRKHSRKRTGSDGKETKSSPEENTEQKSKSFWGRRKSSKVKGNDENNDNISPKKEKDKKKKKSESQKNPTPEHVSSSGRPANLPLPPRPSSVSDEETQYEVVESRGQRPKSNSEDADYETVITSKTRTYDKVNVFPKDQSRPASELYECINDQDTKMKRISSESNQYDVVETRSPPPKKPPPSLEYAYAVVASRDKPLVPTETSSGSGLYEVVSDDMKQKSGVLDTRKSDIVVEDADYAVVQKDPSKKRASRDKEEEPYSQVDKQRQKSRSGEIQPAPAPPPVSSLIHVSASVRRRTQSEGDELNVEPSDSPADSASDRPKTMGDVEETYAKVNLALKKRHSVEAPHPDHEHEFAPASALPEGFYEDTDTPPPVPPSLYADLESMRKDDDKANENQSPSSSSQQQEENDYEEVATKVEVKSITSRPVPKKTVSSVKITQANDRTDDQMEPLNNSPNDPNGVLKRLKPPLGSPRNSYGSASSLEGDKRFSTGSQHNYDEVLTKNAKSTQTDRSSASKSSKDSTSGHYESIENKTKRNSAGNGEKTTTDETDADKIVTYV